jgi:hypothetical protein
MERLWHDSFCETLLNQFHREHASRSGRRSLPDISDVEIHSPQVIHYWRNDFAVL